jgi:hypothetical protein
MALLPFSISTRQAVQGGDEARFIERLVDFEHVEDFADYDLADELTGILYRETLGHQSLEGLSGLRRVIASNLVVHHFEDSRFQIRIDWLAGAGGIIRPAFGD